MLSWFKKKAETPEQVMVHVPEPTPPAAPVAETMEEQGWLARLSSGLAKSTGKLASGLADFATKQRLDDVTLGKLEDLLITTDIGPKLAMSLTEEFGRQRFGDDVTGADVKSFLADAIAQRLTKVAEPLAIDETKKPFVVLMVGVNGSGKTTTLGKLAAQLQQEGRRIMVAAGDTFRAAAVEQLQTWGERAGVPVIASQTGADSASLAFEALEKAKADAADVLLIDTAGRLQNKTDLMAELQKTVRAMQKVDATAPHAVLLVLDATTGQNALSQAQIFRDCVNVTGLVVTKLDGTAKGGIVVALADQQQLPIVAIGVGEGIADLQPFAPDAFARALVGL